jgi:two-component system, chemotaxis family, chemotaxis protein CheY
MAKKVLLVGHCGPDSSYLRAAIRAAAPDAVVQSTCDAGEFERRLAAGIDLLLVNRVLDGDFAHESGVDLIRSLHARHPGLKMILVSNLPDAQADARAAGAMPGFGKSDIGKPAALAALKEAL